MLPGHRWDDLAKFLTPASSPPLTPAAPCPGSPGISWPAKLIFELGPWKTWIAVWVNAMFQLSVPCGREQAVPPAPSASCRCIDDMATTVLCTSANHFGWKIAHASRREREPQFTAPATSNVRYEYLSKYKRA